MMNNNYFIALCATLLLIPLQAIAQVDDATSYTPTSKKTMILCPEVSVGGVVLDSTTKTVSLGDPAYSYQGLLGGVGWAFGALFGTFVPRCPTTYPYITNFTEGWGGLLLIFGAPGSGGAGLTLTCASTPQPLMHAIVGYDSAAGSNTWKEGPSCPEVP